MKSNITGSGCLILGGRDWKIGAPFYMVEATMTKILPCPVVYGEPYFWAHPYEGSAVRQRGADGRHV